jgi:heme/copper-type cytochrome/quinol oxidase subunit 2
MLPKIIAMFRNYFKTAFRSLTANKAYTVITVTGLAVGIAVCLVIFVFIRYEQSFDTFHPGKEHIYRILTIFLTGGVLSVLIALATVSFQAIKAAVANPVKNLRTE